jgi:glycosyltransferase involved in cell wall biosynthesis
MNKVAIVAPDFTPSSYPPALRVKFFAQHLAEFGWEPIILTVNASDYEWPVDAELNQLLPCDLRIIRNGAMPISLTRKCGVGDIGLRSFVSQWRALSRLCRAGEVDLVFISMPPYYPALLGRMAHAFFGIKYVIDYIDPWVYDDYPQRPRSQRSFKRSVSHFLSSWLEPIALKHVSHLIGVSQATTDAVEQRYARLTGIGATEIPYGWSEVEFDYVRRNPRHNEFFSKDDGNYHLCYVGRGGSDMRSVLSALFGAISIGLKNNPTLFNRLRMHFIGTSYAANAADDYKVLPIARDYGVEDKVAEHPERVSYLDALQLLIDADGLIVPGSNQSHYTASKIFPYILANKPLLAIFHEQSTVVPIIRETNGGNVITFDSESQLRERIPRITCGLEGLLGSNESPRTDWTAFAAYSTRSMTSRLAHVFNLALAEQKAIGTTLREGAALNNG